MNQKTFKINRIIAVMMLASVFTFAFVWTSSLASEQSNTVVKDQNATAEVEKQRSITEAGAQGTGSLKRFGALKVSASEEQSEATGSPRVALAADFDSDGVNDLLVAHNNRLVLHRGNINAFAPQTEEAWEATRDGRFVAPFEQKTRSTSVPAAADFIFSGDFNRDAHLDAAFAARGDNTLYVLEGDGKGSFPNLRRIETAGAITSVAAGDVNRADGLTDLIVGTRNTDGFGLQIYSGLGDIFANGSLLYKLPSEAEAIAVGQLNENELNDIAVAVGSDIIVLSGADTTEPGVTPPVEMQRLPQSAIIKSLVAGDFLPDRDNRAELALMTEDGSVKVLKRGVLDTAPVTKHEHLAEQVREYQSKGYPVPERILRQLSAKDLRRPAARPQRDAKTWSEAESMFAAAPQAILTKGQLSKNAAEDLIVLDSSANRVSVLPFVADAGKTENQKTFTGEREKVEYSVEDQPIAVLPMRLNADGKTDLLVVGQNQADFAAFVSAAAATFTVTTAVDDIDNNLGDGVCNGPSGCTLRAAIMEANRLAGDDMIMINAGINPTISRGQPDNDGQGTNDQATGDLDITCVITNPAVGACDLPILSNQNDLVIMGAAGGNTVTAGAFTPYPVNGGGSINTDRVFDVGQDGIFGGGFGGSTGVSAVFTNLTIQNGNVREALNTALGGGNRAFGGGIRYDGFGNAATHGSLTLTNSTINNNQSDNAGGGVYHVYGSHTASGTTFSNNITKAGEGGGLFFGAATSASNVSITNSTFTANEARKGIVFGTATANADGGGLRINADPNTVTINNTNFTNNIAQQDGGAIKTLGALVTVTGGTMTGNTARRHGGVAFGDEDTANSPAFVTFSGSTMRNNTANSDNATPGDDFGFAGDGGAIFRDRGTLNITNSIIGGTGAGEPNTATNGGGVAHAFTVDSAPGNDSNQTIVTINGGSINGNIANTDGGGIYFNAALFDTTPSTLNIGQTTATALNGNKAKNNGGGIHTSNTATANLKDMVLRSNQANSDTSGSGDGGALYQNLGTTTFTGTLTIGGSGFANQAVNGGGIRNNAGTVTLPSNSNITFNSATGTGGGISNAGTLSALATAIITNNTATGNGGGIFNSGTLGAITLPTLSGNSAATGGGLFSSNGALSITNGGISSNVANTGKGGGIEHSGTSASTVTGVVITNNTGSGIHITGTGSLDAANNIITGNSGDGITKIGSGTGSHFNSNTIYTNGDLGIDLSDNGVTPNDAGDGDSGPNNLQNFPVINYVKRGNGVANSTLNAPNGKYRIQYYANTACDASGHGEGESLKATQVVDILSGNTLTFSSPTIAFGTMEQITAIATHDANGNSNFDDDGNTSEFSACRKVNTLPTFTAVQTPSRQQGSPVSNSQIATVTDPDQALNTLVVTVNGFDSATVNGVTVSNIAVDASGNVTANVVASCTATNANFTLRVTDNATEYNETTLNVTVTPNTPPTLGNYPNTTVNLGSSGTVVTPDAAPTDNGTVATLTATAPGFTGTFVGNPTFGTVTVNSAGPSGIYTVTVTATDDCGATTTSTFTLTVNAPPTITGATISRQQRSPSANSQIATVNDADQAENTLDVTINGAASVTVNGVTVSNIVIDASGNVTADVVASCTATNATFTLTVTDSLGASSNATLTVNVTPNTPPTVGTYSTTSVNAGSGTTVTPGNAPADNGSITSATVMASGAFAGTLSVNSTTGVVTISNANPVGSYTVTVTYTDDCGATTSPTFTLNVVDITPPDTTITANPTDPSGPNVSFSFTGTDAESGIASFECQIDGGGFTTCTSPKIYTGLAQGSHTFTVRAIDNAGNVDPTPTSFTWNVDAIAADTTIDSSPPNPSNSGNASFTFSSSETGTFECQLDGGGFTACTSPKTYTGLSDGSHTFMVRAVDGVGNVDASPASYTWVVDTTGPNTAITANPANPSASNSASFSFTGTDTGGSGVASFECKLDGGAFAPCTSGQTYNSLADGSHTFQVRAIDNAGNTDATPASFIWTIDTAPPDTMITSGPPNPSGSSSASFSFSGTDSGTGVASFECKLDGGSFAACTSPKSYSGLSNGSHTFMVRAIDGIGNADPTPASYTWTVDTVAPTVTINQAGSQADPTGGSPINFTVVFSEPVTGFGNSASDIILSGTAGATTFVVTQIAPNNGTTYNVAVSGMNATGTVIASIPAGAANDAAGNGNAVSTSTDNTVTFVLNFPPTVTVVAGGSCGTSGTSGTMNLLVSDANTPLGNVTLSASSSNTALVPNANIVFGGSGANRTLMITAVPQNNVQNSIITITVNDGQGGTSTLTVRVFVGTNQKQTITGSSDADMIFGLNGDDTINAGAGNDLVCGGNGDGVVSGGAGDDTLDGGNGNDTLRGEDGNDRLIGGNGNDRLEGGNNSDTLTGGSGADFFSGGPGTDTATDFTPSQGDTTDGSLALLDGFLEVLENWAE